MKGGKKKMEIIQGQLYQESCEYCKKKFPQTPYESQAKSWKESHERFCKENPSNRHGKQ